MDVSDPTDERELARPATIVVGPDGEEAFRHVSRDFADRVSENEILEVVRRLGLDPVAPAPVELGPTEPGPRSFRLDVLPGYLSGAKFAVTALASRNEEIRPEAGRYLEQIERYHEAVRDLRKRLKEEAGRGS